MDSKNKSNEYGTCRCCQSKGNHRNISKEYVFEGGREVYIEIFMDCFNLFLTTDQAASQLICNKCINQLREANQFRTMVAEAEIQLNSASSKLDTVFINVPTEKEPEETIVKNEPETQIKLEEFSDGEVACDSENVSPDDLLDDESSLVPGEAELLGRAGAQNPLPTRESLYYVYPQFVRHLDLLSRLTIELGTHLDLTSFVVEVNYQIIDVNMTSQMIKARLNQTQAPQKVFISEKQAHLTNASTLIQNSNITPFKSKTRSGFPCYYCRKLFEDLNKLRLHAEDHKSSEIIKVLTREQKQKGIESLVVYVDVTDLKCTICHKNMANVTELKTHLIKEHKKKIYSQVTDRVIPFKMNGDQFECQICLCNFETFGSVERHMNGHYRNYVCKDCGTGFITKYRLKVHCKSMHVDGTHPCEFCGKIFSSQQKYKNHVNTVHKQVKRFKCPKCSIRFGEYFKRQRHMEEIHGFAPLKYKCNVCDKSFDRRYTLSRHLKRDHLEERDYQCEVCAYKCFTKNELTVHMVKHGGERIFECSVCKKSYARKKTLREHMRIHNNDRRFACAVCGQAFVQKCSLKGHLKTHHCNWVMDADSNKCTER